MQIAVVKDCEYCKVHKEAKGFLCFMHEEKCVG